MSTDNQTYPPEDRVIDLLGELIKAVWAASKSGHNCATKHDLEQLERKLIVNIQNATDALNKLSTASDGLSVKVDKLVDDTTKLIAAVKASGNPVTPELTAAITKAQASATAAATEGDKVDAAVAAADEVLPTPAPAAPPV